MRLLAASALVWLLLGAVIIFFYLLKLKRRRRVVSSVFLWQRALEELEANAPFKRLRRNLLLLLQLLALAALVFALARPLITTSALASGNTIIVIDATASMSARDEDGRSRLERAQTIARDMIAGLRADDRAAIIESASSVVVRSPLTSDRAALLTAIGEVRQTDTAGTLDDAILLAEQVAKSEREASIVVIGDGGGASLSAQTTAPLESSLTQIQPQSSSAALRFVRVGRRAANVGIITLNSRSIQAGAPREMFASIANFSDRERSFEAQLRIDGNLVDARSLTAGAGKRTGLIFDALPETGGLAELKLVVDDDLAADNVAYTFLPDARMIRVGVAGDNPFLLRALVVNPDLDVRRIKPGSALADYDCIVGEGAASADLIESNRPVLAINPPDIKGLWQSAGEIERPEITVVDRSHPLNSYLSYGDLHIEGATRREVATSLRAVVSSAGDGLIWAGKSGRQPVVMIGFDLGKSDLPMKVEFPMLLANSVAWLTGRDQVSDERTLHAGQPITIPSASESAIITTPSNEEKEIRARDGSIVFADTRQVGIYRVRDSLSFAASLLSESESDTSPRDSINTRAGEAGGQAETFSAEREVWRWVALAALVLLALEWWVYHRRIAV